MARQQLNRAHSGARLGRGTFAWPSNDDGDSFTMRSCDLGLLLSGIDLTHPQRRRRQNLTPSLVAPGPCTFDAGSQRREFRRLPCLLDCPQAPRYVDADEAIRA